ncbi:MAG: prohibitin family protein [Candidatus Coatesbacteria bacterium]|nr:MAG: prohibitin family protein [Candidatus Coatesbacteria bacterium]
MDPFLFFLGLFVGVGGAVVLAASVPAKSAGLRVGGVVGILMAVLFVGLAMTVVVPPGNVGVLIFFGKVYDSELPNGFHVKNPLANVTLISVKEQVYTMSIVAEEGQVYGDDSIDVLSNEGMTLKLDLSVQYKIIPDKASWIIANKVYSGPVQFEKDYVRPEVRRAIRDVSASYSAAEMYSERRAQVGLDIEKLADTLLAKNGVRCVTVNLRNVKLPPRVTEAIDRKKEAEQEAERMEYVLLQEEKEAQRKRIEASGIRDFQLTVAESLTADLLKWKSLEVADHVSMSANAKIVFFGGKEVPFILGGI